MLASQLGVRLLLLTGDAVPLPPSVDVIDALRRVEVTVDDRRGDGFQLRLAVRRDRLEDASLVSGDALAPLRRVVVGVILGVVPEVLIDGVITRRELQPTREAGVSTLTVTGRDLTQLMELEERNEEYPNQPDSLIAQQVLARYATHGVVPSVTQTTDVPLQTDRVPRQHETDLAFLGRIAGRNGFVFYLEPTTIGVTTAYLGPENRLGVPQPALTVDMGDASNAEDVTLSEEPLAPVGSEGTFVEPFTKQAIPIPPLPPLKIPPLVAQPTTPRRTVLARDTANRNPAQAALATLAESRGAADAVSAEGVVDGVRYGRALRARRLVGMRGVGRSHSGLWYVSRVTHVIQRGSYTQRFGLTREGTGSLVPVVVP